MHSRHNVTTVVSTALFSLLLVSNANAAWQLSAPTAGLNFHSATEASLEIRIRNAGDSSSPAQTLIAPLGFVSGPALAAFRIVPAGGGCGAWEAPEGSSLPSVAFHIPAIEAGAHIRCHYQLSLSSPPISVPDLRFQPGDVRVVLGAITDLSAYAVLLSSTPSGSSFRNRYQVTFQNHGPLDVARYGFGACASPPIGFFVNRDFPGACSTPGTGMVCFSSGGGGIDFSGGPIAAGGSVSCAIETLGGAAPNVSAIRLEEFIFNAAGDPIMDVNSSNDALELRSNTALLPAPGIGWLAGLALIAGVMLSALVERQAKFES